MTAVKDSNMEALGIDFYEGIIDPIDGDKIKEYVVILRFAGNKKAYNDFLNWLVLPENKGVVSSDEPRQEDELDG